MAPVSSFILPQQSMLLLEAWKPLHKDSEWACVNITHAQCNKFSALCCPDGCLCARIIAKMGTVDHAIVLDPGGVVERATDSDISKTGYTTIEVVERMAVVTKAKVPLARKLFVVLTDVVLPLCTPEEEDTNLNGVVDAMCVERFDKYTASILKQFTEEVYLVIFDHHTTQSRNFARIADLASSHGGRVRAFDVFHEATLSDCGYSEPSSWTALKLCVAWHKETPQQIEAATTDEIVACFVAAMGDAVNFRKPMCRKHLCREFSALLGLECVVGHKLSICAANELVKTCQQSILARGVHGLAKGMWLDLSKVDDMHMALQSLNAEVVGNASRFLDILKSAVLLAAENGF